jgi:hypothetical protein
MEEEEEGLNVDERIQRLTRKTSSMALNLRRFQIVRGRSGSIPKRRPDHQFARSGPSSFTIDSTIALLHSSPPVDFGPLYYWIVSESAELIVRSFLKSEELLDALNSAVAKVANREQFWYLSHIVLHLVDLDDTTIIDLGILLTFHEHLSGYESDLLGFYCELAGLSVYARNALACTGILADVVK